MKPLLILWILAVTAIMACNKQGIERGTPSCVKQKIKDFDNTAACSDPSVSEYTFQEKTVYLFDPGTCGADMSSEVISSNCSTLGHLGGFTGNTKINGEEFSNAVFVKLVWKK